MGIILGKGRTIDLPQPIIFFSSLKQTTLQRLSHIDISDIEKTRDIGNYCMRHNLGSREPTVPLLT
jgi:hypothetical protein